MNRHRHRGREHVDEKAATMLEDRGASRKDHGAQGRLTPAVNDCMRTAAGRTSCFWASSSSTRTDGVLDQHARR